MRGFYLTAPQLQVLKEADVSATLSQNTHDELPPTELTELDDKNRVDVGGKERGAEYVDEKKHRDLE